MSGPLSIRTQVRDAIVAALQTIDATPTVRQPGAQILTHYAEVGEIKKSPTLCVIVTNEEVDVRVQMHAEVTLSILVVLYVRSETDVRAALDAAIEDVWEVLRSGQLVKAVVSQLRLDSIDTDEGTTSAKPFAQAVMRWSAQIRRDLTW